MEIFHTAILHCPQLLIQAFVQTLCDLHHFPITGGLREQFSICYDVFIAILDNVELRVMRELSRSDPNWWLKNCCTTCTFKLEGEEELEFSMFGAMDGNDSLKCIPHSKTVGTLVEGDKISSKWDDLYDGGGEYILPRVEVDRWSKEAIGDVDIVNAENVSPCEERWKNMSDDHTSKMWGVFKETGFFLSLCHHGSMLVGADMVKSREQAKYPLAVVAKLLQVFGDRLGIGYDIGCKFGGTVHRSPLRELAKTKLFRMLVSLFHGHAHNRLCQLWHLGTYLKGLGLKDLETLEHFFSKSNALAGCIHYVSRFHCCQHISWYLKHIDRFDSFEHLNIIDSYPALQKSMWELGITNEKEFKAWLQEKEVYLSDLQHEPPEETIEIEYYARLVHYYDIEPPLQWDHVIEYAFLADFDLLRDVQQDMSDCKWATPAGHQAMDMYFKICQAREEIKHLNIKIQQLITYMHTEDMHLQQCKAVVADTDPALALQIAAYQNGQECFYAMHMRWFYVLSKDIGFTGSIDLGIVVSQRDGFGLEEPDDDIMNLDSHYINVSGRTDSESDESDEEEAEEVVFKEVQAIIQVSKDNERQ
ncbi:hypothetical protein EV421DRAFT_1908585 [Armillaria borealis]|uniref:CxC2-like cysteine cluster KDZ transposase-associated domain-containing protein n=1 Tax=Armillaria borealis TaxID=47425 RepID=A0AA39J4Y2_9AGAR|nr:hypothetical protein EV421DRAFT_1908585 [Armillaria borealis]